MENQLVNSSGKQRPRSVWVFDPAEAQSQDSLIVLSDLMDQHSTQYQPGPAEGAAPQPDKAPLQYHETREYLTVDTFMEMEFVESRYQITYRYNRVA